jgi:hypothetical protein
MSEEFILTTTPPPAKETIVFCGLWRAAYIRYPFVKGMAWVFAAQRGRKFFFGPLNEAGFLEVLREKPTDAQIIAFLKDCMTGKVEERGLESLRPVQTAE